MAIHLHRSNRTEALVGMLCEVLRTHLPEDPFQSFPIVVGSRGMERWIRHEVATRMDIAANLSFPFPRQALAGAARWLLDGLTARQAAFWEVGASAQQDAQRWERGPQTFQLVRLLRKRLAEACFAPVARYLGGAEEALTDQPLTARELLFAGEVADVLDRLMHDRPEVALAWAEDPSSADPRHRWLAELLGDLGAATEPDAPAVLHRALMAAKPQATERAMCVFGLSTMGPGDRSRLEAIARSIDIHLFVLVPSAQWFQDQRTPMEARAARRDVKTGGERLQLEADLASDNPVLTSLAAPSRDLQLWLEKVEYQGDDLQTEDPAQGDAPTSLQRLQSWILAAAAVDSAGQPWPPDGSLSAHSAYGALRQCEVLRDELLAMFAADPTLEPRDVVVMTPDIETYAPLVAAVFSRTGLAQPGRRRRLPRIPLTIADLGLSRTNPVAEVLLKTLANAGERLTASFIVEFLALQPVRERWAFDDEDVADLRQLILECGLRWGVDARDREAVQQPPLDQNTVRFALERLALGVLMPDENALGVVPSATDGLGPAVALPIQSRERVARVGRFAGMLRTLCAHRSAMATPATLDNWRERLASALDELTATSDNTSWLRAEVEAALDDMAQVAAPLGKLCVERAAVLRWLEGRFELPQRGERAITGGVQVCALEPMRSVPFRVVALLGMDDKAFPRGGRPRTWDPMEKRLPGERDRREIDRHLMLEAILSARERLLILWSGHDVQQGQVQPAAVPVEELLETLGRLMGCGREKIVVEHALQPWSPGNFGAAPSGFDQGMAEASRKLRDVALGEQEARRLGLAASGVAALPAESFAAERLTLNELAAGLLSPHKLLLRDRLGLSVSYEEATLEDREPLELDHLQTWSLRSRALEQLMQTPEGWDEDELMEALRNRLAGEGALPLRAGGTAILRQEVRAARDVVDNLRDIAGAATDGLELSVRLDDAFSLVGRAEHVVSRDEERLLQWYTPSSAANERLKLEAWLHVLAARAAGHRDVGARLVGCKSMAKAKRAGGEFLAFEGTVEGAKAILQDLVRVWLLARNQPMPLFCKTSYGVANALHKCDGDLEADGAMGLLVTEVARGYHGGMQSRGDREDPWIGTFFVDYDPLDHLDDQGELSLLGLARRVWLPPVRGLAAGGELAVRWIRGADA